MKKFSIYEETLNWCKKNNIRHLAEKVSASTNDSAKNEALQPNDPSSANDDLKLYITDRQTAGRGRSKNSWQNTEPGHSLMCSWSYLCKLNPQAVTGPIVGLALYTALSKIFSLKKLSIKPPNDIYLEDKKILGILVETVSFAGSSRLIIGFGLNVFSSPAEIKTAGHLSQKTTITPGNWHSWLSETNELLLEAARAAQATHLTETQRKNLLSAMNAHPLLSTPYQSISPFGDLVKNNETISWRNL